MCRKASRLPESHKKKKKNPSLRRRNPTLTRKKCVLVVFMAARNKARWKMSLKGGKTSQTESVRRSINEQLTSVGEEILMVLAKQSGVHCVKLVRVFVLERLSLAAEFMFNLFQREIETLETLLERRNKLLDLVLQPRVSLHRTGGLKTALF